MTTTTEPACRAEATRCDPHINSTQQRLPTWRHGRVAWFDTEKGFGFLTPDTGPEVFVDHQVIDVPGFKTLLAGQSVVFTATDTPRGPEATRVVPDIRTPPVPAHHATVIPFDARRHRHTRSHTP
ncbi:cold-shock protein [Nocardia stercoris]|uniref:Cold shock domain-containing protein n=1 Tax=Nocardia stercoris TaxID=2483361 RepID=A0A3M2LKW9_9NOCA|nr:cold shock domain-containing protein [Nocardia stercoris]RMI35468.1 cold shock domain-containing protein [Nocardia stercoris]